MNAERNRLVQIVCIAVVALCLAASVGLSSAIAMEASRAQLSYTDQATEGDPPEVALGIALGAFRGLFVNYLWLRATELKEDGKYYEAIELSQAITRLQPRFPRVWSFHAWNMSYNISVATQTAEERWQWVKAGIDLLRDEAIPRNPNSVLLHRELAWIFLHKIQGFSDDANRYYKREVAREWTHILGTPPALPTSGAEEASAILIEWLEPIVNAPASFETLIERERRAFVDDPNNRTGDEGFESMVQELADQIRERAGLPLGKDLLRLVAMHDAYAGAWYEEEQLFTDAVNANLDEVVSELREDERYAQAWDLLLPFVRRQVLVNDYHMEPARMSRYTDHIGPLDWRHPAAHSIYWAYRGVEQGRDRQSTTTFDTLNTDRMITHSIQELYRTGTMIYDVTFNELVTFNDTNWIEPYRDLLDSEIRARGGLVQDTSQRTYTTFSEGYENFLDDVIRTYYRMGDIENAQRYYRELRTFADMNINDNRKLETLQLPLDEFVQKQMRDRLSIPYVAVSEVYASILDGLLRGLMRNDAQHFAACLDYARELHRLYFEREQNIRTTADAEADRMEAMPRDFSQVVGGTLVSFIASGNLSPIQGAQLYRTLPNDFKLIAFDTLASMYTQRGVPPEVVADLIPEPPGIEQFRAVQRAREQQGFEGQRRGLQTERQ